MHTKSRHGVGASSSSKVSSSLIAMAAALVSIMASGASAQDVSDEPLNPGQERQTLPDPSGAYFAEVTANGTGCPPGTWKTELAADGKTFTTTFSAYETEVTPWRTVSVKDCQLAIKLHSPQGLSYSVESFYYAGFAYLEEGINGRQTARYYFQGDPSNGSEATTTLVGPYDDAYLFEDTAHVTDTVWSPCGTERDLNITTRLRLLNSNPRRTGYMNLSAVDGAAKLVVRLSWRTC